MNGSSWMSEVPVRRDEDRRDVEDRSSRSGSGCRRVTARILAASPSGRVTRRGRVVPRTAPRVALLDGRAAPRFPAGARRRRPRPDRARCPVRRPFDGRRAAGGWPIDWRRAGRSGRRGPAARAATPSRRSGRPAPGGRGAGPGRRSRRGSPRSPSGPSVARVSSTSERSTASAVRAAAVADAQPGRDALAAQAALGGSVEDELDGDRVRDGAAEPPDERAAGRRRPSTSRPRGAGWCRR